jgi:hypothetical protein
MEEKDLDRIKSGYEELAEAAKAAQDDWRVSASNTEKDKS